MTSADVRVCVIRATGAILCAIRHPTAGTDLSDLVKDTNAPGLPAAYHQYPACGCSDAAVVCFNRTREACNNSPRGTFNFMGYSVRTAAFRYTAWFPWKNTTLEADWEGPYVFRNVAPRFVVKQETVRVSQRCASFVVKQESHSVMGVWVVRGEFT
jgi:hypothetical protein